MAHKDRRYALKGSGYNSNKKPATVKDLYKLKVQQEFSADVSIPSVRLEHGYGYYRFGENNLYPNEVLYLFDKSPKHGSIVNGKTKYIFGKGFAPAITLAGKMFLLNVGNKFSKKAIFDIELFGGTYIEVIPTRGGGYKYFHLSYDRCRSNENNTVIYYKKNWHKNNDKPKEFPAFYKGIKEVSVIYYKQYRPGNIVYATPSWFQGSNYIAADTHVSKHTLNNAKSGFTATKFINFFNGDPGAEKEDEIVEQFENSFTGSEGKKIVVGFNDDPDKAPTISDLGISDLSKENFSNVDEIICNNIYAAHGITNQSLFGIPLQSGKLSGSSEMREAYDIFNNTYAKPNREEFENLINFLAYANNIEEKFVIIEMPPVGIVITEDMIKGALDRNEIRKMLGQKEEAVNPLVNALNSLSPLIATKVLDTITPNQILSIVGLPPVANGDLPNEKNAVQVTAESDMVNEHLKNLSGRQSQNMTRIIRLYSTGKMPKEHAALLLKSGLGLTDAQIETLLQKPVPVSMSSQIGELELGEEFLEKFTSNLFEDYGEARDTFTVHESFVASFSEGEGINEAFGILDKIKGVIASLPKIEVKYSYEKRSGVSGEEVLPTTRPFCAKLCTLNRLYSRADISKISQIVGFNVFDRGGGFWRQPNGQTSEQCRHGWKMHIVTKK